MDSNDVRISETGQNPSLLHKPFPRPLPAFLMRRPHRDDRGAINPRSNRIRKQFLDRHVPPECPIVGCVSNPKPAFSEDSLDLVIFNTKSCGKGETVGFHTRLCRPHLKADLSHLQGVPGFQRMRRKRSQALSIDSRPIRGVSILNTESR